MSVAHDASKRSGGVKAVIAPPKRSRITNMIRPSATSLLERRQSRTGELEALRDASGCHTGKFASQIPPSAHSGSLPSMDSRRRSVMQPMHDPAGNTRSNIPLPSTIKKPPPASSSSRLSLAGPALRAANALTVPGTNPRQSMLRSQNVNPLLQSTSKQNYGRTPLSKCAYFPSNVVLQL